MKIRKGLIVAIELIAVLVVVLFLVGPFVGIPTNYIIYGPNVASGIGSKLLCSSIYVTGYSREQAFNDLVQYSSILEQLTIEYNDESRTVTTSLFGIQEKSASALPNLGCTVNYEGHTQRQELVTQAGTKNQAPWPLGSGVATIDANMQRLIESLVASDNAAGLNTRALLVAYDGAVIGEAYDQEATASSPLLGWSMAKSLMAVALGNLEYRGLLDLDQAPGFSEWNDERKQISLVDMLNMADGLEFSEEYDPGDDATAMLFTEPSASAYVMQQGALHKPGAFFNYSSGTANLLSKVHQDTLGSPQIAYDDFRENIFLPMGFQDAVFETDASGLFVGSSYFYASAQDWARLGQVMLNDGTINGQRIVSADWVQTATSPNQTENDKAYGYQWWLNRGNERLRFENLPADMYYASGNRRQFIMVFPSHNVVIVRLGWSSGPYPIGDNFGKILESL